MDTVVAKKNNDGQYVFMKKLLMFFVLLCFPLDAEPYRVLGLASPCIDYILPVQDEDLIRLNLQKRGRRDMDGPTLSALIENCQDKQLFTGGCASNTIKGLASLGISCAMTGNVAKDFLGNHIREVYSQLQVDMLFTETETPTAQVACLITPDGERSFCANTQAEREISESHLKPEYFEGVQLVHTEGYRLYNGMYLEKALHLAQSAGAKVSLDIANVEIAKKFRERIFALLENYTDILFLNEEEAHALTQLPPDKAAQYLVNFCPIVVVKEGENGCWVSSPKEIFHLSAIPTHALDTTGAGDLFASAFLYGYLSGYPLKECARLGNLAGCAAVERVGAELSCAKWQEILRQL